MGMIQSRVREGKDEGKEKNEGIGKRELSEADN